MKTKAGKSKHPLKWILNGIITVTLFISGINQSQAQTNRFRTCQQEEDRLRLEMQNALPPQPIGYYQNLNRTFVERAMTLMRQNGIFSPAFNEAVRRRQRPSNAELVQIEDNANGLLARVGMHRPASQVVCPTGFNIDPSQLETGTYLQPSGVRTYMGNMSAVCRNGAGSTGALEFMDIVPWIHMGAPSDPNYSPRIFVATTLRTPVTFQFRGETMTLDRRSIGGYYYLNTNRFSPDPVFVFAHGTGVTIAGRTYEVEEYLNRYLSPYCRNFHNPSTASNGEDGNGGGAGGGAVPITPNVVDGNGGGGSGGVTENEVANAASQNGSSAADGDAK